MLEFGLGDPVEKTVNGKTLRVVHLTDHTEIKYGDEQLTLCKETVLEGLAVAIEWALKLEK